MACLQARSVALLGLVALAACSGSGPQGPRITRIEVAPDAVLFTAAGQTHALTARAFDQDDQPIQATFTWTSSDPAAVSVSSTGEVRSLVAVGSSQITATASGVESAPAGVIVATPAAGAVLVLDSQVVSGPVPIDPEHALDPGAQTRLTLSGVTGVVPGAIVLAAEAKPIAGRIVSVTDLGSGKVEVILEAVTLRDVFAHYSIVGRHVIQDEISSPVPDGRRNELDTDPVEGSWGPLKCKLAGSLTFQNASFTYTMKPDVAVDYRFDESIFMVKMTGTLARTMKGSVRLGGELTGTASCKLETFRKTIPLGGPLAALVALQVPAGAKADLSLTLKSPSVEVGFENKATTTLTTGFSCDLNLGACSDLSTSETTSETKPIYNVSDSLSSFRLEGNAGVYGYIGLDLGSPIGQAVGLTKPFGIVELTAGIRQEFTFGNRRDQAHDTSYASNYALKLRAELGFAADAKKAMKNFIGTDVALKAAVVLEKPLDESPTGKHSANRTQVPVGEQVKLTVDLTPEHLSYLGIGYNVNRVEIYRKAPGRTELDEKALGSVSASNGQAQLTWTWTPTAADVGTNSLYAFVVSNGTELPLEAAKESKIDVEVIGDGHVKVSVTGTMSQSFTYSGGSGSEATTVALTYDLNVDAPPFFAPGGPPFLASYSLAPRVTGTVKHQGVKDASGVCDFCQPSLGNFTEHNDYDVTADAAAAIVSIFPDVYVSLTVPAQSTTGTLAFSLPGVELSGTATGKVTRTGCGDPDTNKPVTSLPTLGTIALPKGIDIAVPEPSKPGRLQGSVSVTADVSVGYPSSQSASPASWTVPLVVTIEYDLPYNPSPFPPGFPTGFASATAGAVRADGVARPAATAVGPVYFGRQPLASGRSVPALLAGPPPASPALALCQ